jgi:hypothetical protein
MAKPGTTAGAEATDKATGGRITWLGAECRDGETAEAERPDGSGEAARSQSPHSTDVARATRGTGSKTVPREGGQEGGCGRDRSMQAEAPGVPQKATQGADAGGSRSHDLSWAEASIWTERMVAALVNSLPPRRRGASEAASSIA